MKTSINGLILIKKYEGFRSEPYLCPAGVPTIGYGATYYPDGTTVTMSDASITKSQATVILKEMLLRYEAGVRRYVTADINNNMFDALVSFVYNLGLGAFKRSTLLKMINANPCNDLIFKEFKRWCRANGKILNGLKRRRREEEATLYFS